MSNGNFNSLQFFPLNFDHRWSMDKHAILAVKTKTKTKRTWYFSARNTSRKLCLGSLCAKRRHLDCFSITITQRKCVMQHFPFCRHFRFCLSSAYTVRAYIWRKWVLMSLQTAKCHMIVQMRVCGRNRQWWRAWIFRSNSAALPPWDVNCPFPFPSDQGGHDKTNCRPVILSTFSLTKTKAHLF